MPANPIAGDFFLAPIGGWVGAGIALGQFLNGDGFRKYQHAGIYLGDGKTVEAMPGGAIQGSIEHYKPESLMWSSGIILLSHDQRADICQVAKHEIGTPYSFVDYLSLALARFGMRPQWLKSYVANSRHMICSQLVDQVYFAAGVHLFDDGRIDGDVTPADLVNLLLSKTV